MQIDKEKWIEEVWHSIDGVSRASSPDLTSRVMSRLANAKSYHIPAATDTSLVWRIAASMILLVLINVLTLYSYQSHLTSVKYEIQIGAAASELGLGGNAADPAIDIFGK